MDFQNSYDGEAKIWHGVKKTKVFNPECSLGQIVLHILRSKPAGAVCQISDDESTTLTYETATLYAVRIAQALAEMGITQDDIVGLVTPNSTYQMPIIVGCWLNGTAYHGVSGLLEERVIKHCFNITKPKVIFCAAEYCEKVRRATSELNVKYFTMHNYVAGVPHVEELLEPTGSELFYQAEPLKYGATQTMAIMCSSGTTGLPKAVKLSNEMLLTDIPFCNGRTIYFTFSTLDWGTGTLCVVSSLIQGGTRILTTRPFSPEYMLDVIHRYKVTFLLALPTQLLAVALLPNCTEEKLSSMGFIFCAGGHCPPALQEAFRSKITNGLFGNTYGTSETSGMAANLSPYKPRSVGNVLPNMELKIIDPETKVALGPNELGEIYARSNARWTGYYDNPQATAETQDTDGWVRTGDLGYFDDEQYLFVVDRNKDVLKYKGMQYTPHEIEEVVLDITDVVDVCVFGVDSEESGDSAAAAVVKAEGSDLTAEQVVKYVAEKNTVYKQLHAGVYFVAEIPRNTNGKVLRREIKEICLNGGKKNSSKL